MASSGYGKEQEKKEHVREQCMKYHESNKKSEPVKLKKHKKKADKEIIPFSLVHLNLTNLFKGHFFKSKNNS